MKKIIFLLFILVIPILANAAPVRIVRTLIIPFENLSDQTQFTASDKVGEMIIKSIRQFVSYVPTIEMPQTNELRRFVWNQDKVSQIARSQGLDYVIFGDYSLTGDPSFPDANIHVRIWSGSSQFRAGPDLLRALRYEFLRHDGKHHPGHHRNSLNISIPDYAIIRLYHIDVGDEPHLLYVNNRYVCLIQTNDFNVNLKVYANEDYRVVIRRSGNVTAYSALVNIPAKATTNLTFNATGSITIPSVYGTGNRPYTMTLNGQPAEVGLPILSVPSGRRYNLRIVSSNGSVLFDREYPLHDGDYLTIRPDLNDARRFRFNAFAAIGTDLTLAKTSDRDLFSSISGGLGFGVSMKFGRRLYCSIGLGETFQTISSSAAYSRWNTFFIPDLLFGWRRNAPDRFFAAYGIVLRPEINVLTVGAVKTTFPSFSFGFGWDVYTRMLYMGTRLVFKVSNSESVPEEYQDDTMLVAQFYIGFGY
jgi:hypothetical protein